MGSLTMRVMLVGFLGHQAIMATEKGPNRAVNQKDLSEEPIGVEEKGNKNIFSIVNKKDLKTFFVDVSCFENAKKCKNDASNSHFLTNIAKLFPGFKYVSFYILFRPSSLNTN